MNLKDLMNEIIVEDGVSQSGLDGVSFFRSHNSMPKTPLVYEPGIVVVGQGSKIGYLEDRVFHYNPENYLVLSVPMPFECETYASKEEPLLGVYISIDMTMLHELIGQMKETDYRYDESDAVLGLYSVPLGEDMKDAVIRLLKAIRNDKERDILGKSLVREILFRCLCGTHSKALLALSEHQSNLSRVSKTMDKIHTEFSKKLSVEELAFEANMSVSAFHRAFKEVTSDSPLQYIKKIRLNKAHTMLVQDKVKANIAAIDVGYESVSQFSREFKRHFGITPSEVARI